MPLYDEGFGTALGNALGGATTNFLQTQNTLKLQDQQRQQQDADNAYRQQQAAEQTRQYNTTADTNRLNRIGDLRATDMQSLSSSVNDHVTLMTAKAKQYDPSNGPGSNPALYQYYETRRLAAIAAWSKLSRSVGGGENWDAARTDLLNVIGPGHETAAPPPMDMHFAPPPTQPAAPAPPMAAPPSIGSAPLAPPLASAPPSAPEAAQPAASAPTLAPAGTVTAATLPADYMSIPASDMNNIPDSAIMERYGVKGLEYVTRMRGILYQRQIETRQITYKALNSMWGDVIKNITSGADKDVTPAQTQAAFVLTRYGAMQEGGTELTPAQQAEYAQATRDIAGKVYTRRTWDDLLKTKDPNIIAQAYGTYSLAAPDVVAGFDVKPFQRASDDTHNEQVSAAYQQTTQGDKNVADAAKFRADAASKSQEDFLRGLLNGETKLSDVKDPLGLTALMDNPNALNALGLTREVVQQRLTEVQAGINQGLDKGNADLGATLATTGSTLATTVNTQATTKKTLTELLGVRTEAGVKSLTLLASLDPRLSYDQIGRQYPGIVSQFKAALGVNDVGFNNLIRQAQAVYGQGFRGKDLENQLKSSQIQTDGANRDGISATTEGTRSTTRARDAKLQPELDKLNVEIANAVLAGKDTTSLIAQRDALLPGQVAIQGSTVANTNAGTAKITTLLPGEQSLQGAQLANYQSEIDSRKTRDQAYVTSVANGGKLDAARIKQMAEDTALAKAKREHPELFTTGGKAANPLTALTQRAEVNYKAGREAAKGASLLQTQINALTPKLDTFNRVIGMPAFTGTAAEQTAAENKWTAGKAKVIAGLTVQMNTLTQRSLNQKNAGDKIISDGLQNPAVNPPASGGTPNSGISTGQYQAIASSVTPGPAERPQETRFLNALRGAEGNPNYGLVTESSGNTQQDRAIALSKVRRWSTEYGNNTGHFAGMNPSKAPAVSGGDFTPAFVQMFSNVYAPQGVANDPTNLNANHAGNLMGFMQAGGWSGGGQTPKVTTTGTKAAAVTTAPPKSAGTALPVVQTQPAPAAQTPSSVKPQGSVGAYMSKLASSGWITKAQNVTTKADSEKLLDAAARMVMPSGTPDQIKLLKGDLSKTMGW